MNAVHPSGASLERVTPRIDTIDRCRCRRPIVWDEVHGWLHLASATPDDDHRRPPHPCGGSARR